MRKLLAAYIIAFLGVLFLPLHMYANDTEFEQRVFELTNAERAAHGLPPFLSNPALSQAARDHSRDMSVNGFISHTGSNGSSPTDRLAAVGLNFGAVVTSFAENVATGQPTPESVVNAWMNSQGHRANILSNNTYLGVGRYGNATTQKFVTSAPGVSISTAQPSQQQTVQEPAAQPSQQQTVQEPAAQPNQQQTVQEPAAQPNQQQSGQGAINVTINGSRVIFTDQPPIIINDRTLVPVRGVFENMGFEVDWEASTSTATIINGEISISIVSGANTFIANGQTIVPDVPQQIVNDRLMLPLRAISESANVEVNWNEATSTVVLATQRGNRQPAQQAAQAAQQQAAENQQTNNPQVDQSQPNMEGAARSNITLPNRRLTDAERNAWIADYRAMGGPTSVELEIIRLINIERANRNLSQLELDETLMMAARFFAQQAADIGRVYGIRAHAGGSNSHNFGPYADNPNARSGASFNVSVAFGANMSWLGGNWFGGGNSPAETVVRSWMGSQGHQDYILHANHNFIGVGQFPGGITYLFLSARASGPENAPAQPGQNQNLPRTATLNVNSTQPDRGTVTGGGSFEREVPISISAIPNPGFVFENWSAFGSGAVLIITDPTSPNTTVIFPETLGQATVNARFLPQVFNVTSTYTEGGRVTGPTTANFRQGVVLRATPNTGYRFSHWEVLGGDLAPPSGAQANFSMPARDVSLRAVFVSAAPTAPIAPTVPGSTAPAAPNVPTEAQLVVIAQPQWAGTATGGGTVTINTDVNISATANTGYVFDSWVAGPGVVVSDRFSPNTTVTVTTAGMVSVTATFIQATVQPQVPTQPETPVEPDNDEPTDTD